MDSRKASLMRESAETPAHIFLRNPTFRYHNGELQLFLGLWAEDPSTKFERFKSAIGNDAKYENTVMKSSGSKSDSESDSDHKEQKIRVQSNKTSKVSGTEGLIKAVTSSWPDSADEYKSKILNTKELHVYIHPYLRRDLLSGAKNYIRMIFTDHNGDEIEGCTTKSLQNEYVHRVFRKASYAAPQSLNKSLYEIYEFTKETYLGAGFDSNNLLNVAANKGTLLEMITRARYFSGPIYDDDNFKMDYKLPDRLDEQDPPLTTTVPQKRPSDTVKDGERPRKAQRRFPDRHENELTNRDQDADLGNLKAFADFWPKFCNGDFKTVRELIGQLKLPGPAHIEVEKDPWIKKRLEKIVRCLNLTLKPHPYDMFKVSDITGLSDRGVSASGSRQIGAHKDALVPRKRRQYDWDSKLELSEKFLNSAKQIADDEEQEAERGRKLRIWLNRNEIKDSLFHEAVLAAGRDPSACIAEAEDN